MKKYLLLLGSVIIPVACSVEKNTDTTRFYNSMTAKYNIYFNGYENYKAGLEKINANYVEDYAEMLKVFEFSDPSVPSMCAGDMDRAIMKASKLISLKSITARPEIKNKRDLSEKEKKLMDMKEFNEWVDDSYLLIGKARFYRHEFNEARSLFDYSIINANEQGIRTEAAIWLARVNNEEGKYPESLRILSELDLNSGFTKTLKAMYYTTMADLYVKQKRYEEAIEPLSAALELISGKISRYRLTYLLAQLYEKTGNGALATSSFQKVIKMRPPYDVEFYARINIAGVFDINSMDPVKMKKELMKMLRDSKNVDFQDRIYFALGNLSMREGKEEEALEFYQKSASAISQNQNQRGRSFLALANYYFGKSDFSRAAIYFDSTVYFLDPAYPDYKDIQSKSQNLNALVSQLQIIQLEDSLQKVARMSEAERNALISSIIAQATADETSRKESEYTDRYNMGQFYENERRFQGNIEQEGKWYFYNQSALAFGRTEFRRRWGDRKLEDNWRRSNRARVSSQQFGATDEEEQQPLDTTLAESDYRKPEYYLKDLPLNDSLMAISDDRIANALLNAGKAYNERLNDKIRATETFDALIARFPGSELIPEALFILYRVNKEENSPKSEASRQQLLLQFPESEYAKILSDPEYYEKKIAEMKMAEKTYSDAFLAYTTERFGDAITLCDEGLSKYPENILAPKFQLLKAYATARTGDERSFKAELNKIVKTWPSSTESSKAGEIIAFLNQKSPELKVEEDKEIAAELYKSDTTAIHLFALVINEPSFNINQATFDVISYNIDNFTNRNYRTEGSIVNNKYIIITVAGFKDLRQAMDYYNNFSIEKNIRNSAGRNIISFIISADNLKILNDDTNPGRYHLFFLENYLK